MAPKSTTLQSLCLALVIAVAPAIGFAVLMSIIISLVQEVRFPREKQNGVSVFTSEVQVFGLTGEALIRVQTNGQQVRLLDSQRRPVEGASRPILPLADVTRPHVRRRLDVRDPLDVNGILPLTYPESLDVDWFLVLADRSSGRAYFEGFQRQTAQRIGWIGTEGFLDALPPEKAHFVVDPDIFLQRSDRIVLSAEQIDWKTRYFEYPRTTRGESPLAKHQFVFLAGEQLFLIDMSRRTVEELLPGQPVRAVDSTVRPLSVAADRDERAEAQDEILELTPYIVARTSDRIILLSPGAKVREEYSLPEELREINLGIGLPIDGSLAVQSFQRRPASDIRPDHEYTIGATVLGPEGKMIRSEHVVLVNHHVIDVSDKTQLSLTALVLPAPVASLLLPATVVYQDEPVPFPAALPMALSRTWSMQLLITLVALGMAWWTDRRQRALGLGRSVPWLAFVFLFGLPGFLAYLVHRRWPVQKSAPMPKRLGIEVFG